MVPIEVKKHPINPNSYMNLELHMNSHVGPSLCRSPQFRSLARSLLTYNEKPPVTAAGDGMDFFCIYWNCAESESGSCWQKGESKAECELAGSADLLILLNPNETFCPFHKRYYVCRTVITSLHSCILTKRSQDLRRRSISLRLPKSVPLGLWLTKRDYANVSYRSKVVSASSVLVGLC